MNSHTEDVTAITVSNDGAYAATGQVGSAPVAFLWGVAN